MTGDHNLGNCFARRHMPAQVNAFYQYALACFKAGGYWRRSDRRDAVEFDVSPHTVQQWVNWLIAAGWIKQQSAAALDRVTGRYLSGEFEVTEHDAWTAANGPESCLYYQWNDDIKQGLWEYGAKVQRKGKRPKAGESLKTWREQRHDKDPFGWPAEWYEASWEWRHDHPWAGTQFPLGNVHHTWRDQDAYKAWLGFAWPR